MTDIEPEEDLPPVAHVTMVYTGPVAPHWEMKVRYGDQKMLDDFWTRVNARLLLLPKHDPQFRRNRERVNRDAERERIICDWDLGEDDAESTSTPSAVPEATATDDAPAPADAPQPDAGEAPTAAAEQPAEATAPAEGEQPAEVEQPEATAPAESTAAAEAEQPAEATAPAEAEQPAGQG